MKKVILFAAIMPCFCVQLPAQYIYTFAGNGTPGYAGDGGPATLSEMDAPVNVAVDNSGNVYITDDYNPVVRIVNAAGIISTCAGNGTYGYNGDGGPATAAEFGGVSGIVVDNSGNLYISDGGYSVVRKVSASGIVTTIAGTGITGYNGEAGLATGIDLKYPAGLAVDNAGNIYVADNGNNRVCKIEPSGMITTIAGFGGYTSEAGYTGDGGSATDAKLNSPTALAIDATGDIFIADENNNVVRKIDPSGIITTFAGNHSTGGSGNGGPATAGEFNEIWGVAVDAASNVYIADLGNNVVRRVDASGILDSFAGTGSYGYTGDGGPAVLAEFYYPIAVAASASGANVYIADFSNNVIRVVGALPSQTPAVSKETIRLTTAPNPTDDILTVQLNDAGTGTIIISVSDENGAILMEKQISNYQGNGIPLFIKGFPPGMYFVAVKTETGQYVSEFVKR
jgi:trimeric autotransporter adhesin